MIAKGSLSVQELHHPPHRPVQVGRGGCRAVYRRVAGSGTGIIHESLHDPLDPLDRAAHVAGDGRIGASPLEDLDVSAERTEGIAHLVGDSGGQAADARQLLDMDDVTLDIQQIFRHGAVTGCQAVEFDRTVPRLQRPRLPGGQRIGLGGEAMEGADDQPVQHRHAEEDEDRRAAEPQRAERADGFAEIAAREQERGQPDQDHRGGSDEPEADQQLGAQRSCGLGHARLTAYRPLRPRPWRVRPEPRCP